MNNLWSDTAEPMEMFADWLIRHGWPACDSDLYDTTYCIMDAVGAYSRYKYEWEPSLPMEVGE